MQIFTPMEWLKIQILLGTYCIFGVWICLSTFGQNLESESKLPIPKTYQLIGRYTSEKTVDIQNDQENMISQKFEEIKKSGTDLQTTKPPYQPKGNNASEKILDVENDHRDMISFAETHMKEVSTQRTATTRKGVCVFSAYYKAVEQSTMQF